ncbi:quinoprotein glucose dehydrogenase [Catalinimonas alkaloidigena]|uniref:Quinoprotein glucose dehydrogenase n=1 Tax=Catalinimonas alkaloidigena TaxID=1075417 RepID=A0A1G9JJ17_9BACT|nr:PQQ-binding-like beta-propeller repeat protein [Catalinimonas alkaloidigena]SDL37282.1 quinoprotein glucose dehydrogenase [Catalinimonas alkaloidigena]
MRHHLLCLFIGCLLAACQLERSSPEATQTAEEDDPRNWAVYGGDFAGSRYKALGQLDTLSVSHLERAWTYRTGDWDETSKTQIQTNPLVIDGVLYGVTPQLNLFALDAATGKERWTCPTQVEGLPSWSGFSRGLAAWQDGSELRLLFGAGAFLHAIDAATGQHISSFGKKGVVDLREGLGADPEKVFYVATTPGVVYNNLIIMGGRVSEEAGAAPGYIRAFDVRTGKLVWTFHTIPQPGEPGYDTWEDPDAWRTAGGANAWSGLSLDRARRLVFAATGSASYDFYGGDRPGQNLFANCVLALDAATGERKWHFQTVHHDIWDRDLPAQPNLVTIQHNGRMVDAVAQITKTGFVFVLDRDTGEPIFPVNEVPVPASPLPGEKAWPTQPVPVAPPPFTHQVLTEELLTTRTPAAHAAVKHQWEGYRHKQRFEPPSLEGTVLYPGYDGGGEWGGAAFDPTSGYLYVNANQVAAVLTMKKTEPGQPDGTTLTLAQAGKVLYDQTCVGCHGPDRAGNGKQYPSLLQLETRLSPEQIDGVIHNGRGMMPAFTHLTKDERSALIAFLTDKEGGGSLQLEAKAQPPYVSTGYHWFLDPDGYPATKPPWGTLNAIDLNKGEIAWQVPLGDYAELDGPPTGTENYGGPVVTAGGLVLIAATRDEKFRAFDKRTGQLLWETQLPVAGYATPATYEVDGRQYVVVAAGGGKLGTPSGNYYIAYALPQ